MRIALYINQGEKRGVWAGTYWYWNRAEDGILKLPSFKTSEGTLHCYLITGWKTIKGKLYLEAIPWIGENFGDKGKAYISEEIFNALMQQSFTGSYTITKLGEKAGVPIGITAILDHLTYFIRELFHIKPSVTPEPPKPVPPMTVPIEEPSKRELLALEAKKWLGKDVTPQDNVPDGVACVEVLVKVAEPIYPELKGLTYTPVLHSVLKMSPKFKATLTPSRGSIIVSPTEGDNVGHCGIFLSDTEIASNSSKTGRFEKNYTFDSWIHYFRLNKGLHAYIYEPR